MSEAEDLELITRVVDEAQNLLKGHLELDSADAPTTIANLDALLNTNDLVQALERTKLRAMNAKLKQG